MRKGDKGKRMREGGRMMEGREEEDGRKRIRERR